MIDYASKLPKDAIVADMGCGEAQLAKTLMTTRPDIKVHSFDLVAANELITATDIKRVPLAQKSADLVIFCLSLMGVNFLDFIQEAKRILKIG